MSARSSRPELALALVAAAACSGSSKPKPPEADPAKVTALASKMLQGVPNPAGVRGCEYTEMLGGATLTRRTLNQLAHRPLGPEPELAEYVNPTELDSPAARTLIDSRDTTTVRQAAAELLAAPSYLVYHVDLVDSPLPLGVKDFKRPTVGARAIRYDRTGTPQCVLVFFWSQSREKHAWAVKLSDKPTLDPAVVKAMQVDLTAELLKRIGSLAVAPAPVVGPADDRMDRINGGGGGGSGSGS
jgi:hypothetical protein